MCATRTTIERVEIFYVHNQPQHYSLKNLCGPNRDENAGSDKVPYDFENVILASKIISCVHSRKFAVMIVLIVEIKRLNLCH